MSAGNTQALLSQSPTELGDQPVEHAFIEGDSSHRQSKKFKQRLKYRLDLGYTYEDALRLASIKEIAGQTGLRLLPSTDKTTQSILPNPTDEMLPHVDDSSSEEILVLDRRSEAGRISSVPQIRLADFNSYNPSQDEIHLEVEKLKLAGFMTEIPTRTNFVSSAESIPSQKFPPASPQRPLPEIANSANLGPSRIPYWTVATLACCWLVYSMTISLPGHWFWNLLVAVAFEFTPMLMLGARVDKKSQKSVFWGSLGIFLVGLGLYLAPSIQMLINESSAYVEGSARYDTEVEHYKARSANMAALIKTAKADADRSAQIYEDALLSYGENSWRTSNAKKQKFSDAAEWKRQSLTAESTQAPLVPKISDDLTKAAQAIATRIGLFAVVFLSMFVMRRLEEPAKS